MSKYLLSGPKMAGTMTLSFDEAGLLRCWQIDADLTPEQWGFLNDYPLLSYSRMIAMEAKEVFEITPFIDNLSFTAFWDLSGHKVGNVSRIRRTWDSLTEGEKMAVMRVIPKYKQYLTERPSMEQAHASTWLNQRRWENNDYTR